MGGPDEKSLERAVWVQWHAPLCMPSAAPVSCGTAKQAAATSRTFSSYIETIKKECFFPWKCPGFWENSVLAFCLLDGVMDIY